MSTNTNQKQFLLLISTTLVAATLIAYEPMRHNDFVGYDDPAYIMENSNVTGGITPTSIVWAFSKSHAGNWHPLTWLSHTLDCELYGLKPLGHHITNLLFHIANTLLLFWLLQKMTGALWKSAFVAAAFALHPVHVESVAWAAERKDVLSGLFWMLTMLAYVHYVKKPDIKSYMLVILAFMMGLMSKPMVVTLPFVLLLLDYWPLDRFQNFKASFFKLVYEKIPLFALSAASCVITFFSGKAIESMESWPWHARIVTALGNYFYYLEKILYPKDLAVLYPFPEKMSIQLAGAVILVTALLLYFPGRGRRWLAVGLLWYLGTLVPVIGLVQTGAQMMADRYTYIPSIGIFIIIAWGIEEICSKLRHYKALLISGATVLIVVMVLLTRTQLGYWQSMETLFGRTIAVTKNNYIILYDYGHVLCDRNKFDEGLALLKEAARINPQYMPAVDGICTVYLAQNKFDEAISCFNEALQKAKNWPGTYEIYIGLGYAYEQKGNLELAESNYRKALTLNPKNEFAQNNLASVLAKRGQKTDDR
jgi:tetratricopeptide (TPR) repeat protein